jgi:ABC-type multidrug transport system permease subunit
LFFKERKDQFYSPAAWVLAKSLVTFPVEGLLCLVFSAITYFMMGFQKSASKFFIFFGILLLFQLVAESTGLLFAIANKSPVYAIVWLSLVLVVALSLAGFLTYEMPIWYRWVQDSNVFRFAILALLINEFDGLQFTTPDGGTIDGISALPVGLKPSLSMGEYIGILIGALFILRITAVAVLHYSNA